MTEDADEDFLSLLDELRIVAQAGLEYADGPYDEERYGRVLELVSEWYGRSVDLPAAEVRDRFAAEVGHVTPKIGADAAVFDSDGRILLQLRAGDDTWCLPGGYVDPNESPRETAVRETREETGLVVEPMDLLGVYTRKPGEYGPHCLVIHLYSCTVLEGTLEPSHEADALRYWHVDDVPEWHKNHALLARDARNRWIESG